jgi:hypothetical protein
MFPRSIAIAFLALIAPGCVTGQDQLPPESPPAPAAAPPAPAATPGTPQAAAGTPPKTCSGETQSAADGALDDFEDGNGQVAAAAGRNGYWFTAKDEKGSTIEPTGEFKVADGGAGSKKAANVKGKTVAVDGAWGATVGVNFVQGGFYDVSKYAGVSFKIKAAKAGSVRVKFHDVNTVPQGGICSSGCWNAFGKDLSVAPEWQEVKVLFSELKQQDGWGDPRPASLATNKVQSLEWSIDKGQEFDVWIDDVQLIDCK